MDLMNIEEEIVDEISAIQVGSGYYATTIGIDAAQEVVDAVMPLVERAQELAFEAGWMSSGEGCNGEYPDEGVPWEASAGREAYERWVEAGAT